MFLIKPIIYRNMILKWNSTIASIPHDCVICDGTNGTPDLRDRFVKSILTNLTPVGSIGGSNSVVLGVNDLPTHTHTVNDPGHSHIIQSGSTSSASKPSGNPNPISGTGGTTSNATTGIILANVGSNTAHENRPLSYEVVYIMKITDN